MTPREEAEKLIAEALNRRARNGGRHLHHEGCIHNLPPEDQIEMRGSNVDWWMRVVGTMPEQITPDDWESQ
jgi:hypothetical protein